MKRYIFIVLALVATAGTLMAKEPSVEITGTSVKKVDENVIVKFNIETKNFPADHKVKVSPIIYGQEQAMELEPTWIVGKRRNISDKRTGETAGERRVVSRKQSYSIEYTAVHPYQSWMQTVSIDARREGQGCCNTYTYERENLAKDKLLYYEVTPYFDPTPYAYELTELEKYDLDNPFLHPAEDYAKRYDILLKDRDKGTSVVFFKVSSHIIDMDFQGNSEVLAAFSKAFDLIESDPNATLKKIMVAGYASPEGSLAYNTRLAQRRAESVQEFIRGCMKKVPNDTIFELYNGREDWNGLRERVENSNMAEKNEILEIIDGYTMEQEIRKTRLKALNGGAPYRYMLENFYPPLRNAGYVQVYYEIDRKATVATAVTDERGRTTWVDPNSPSNINVTLINQALEMMVDHRFADALQILQQINDDPKSWNALGVCYMMTRDLDRAEEWFLKALENGDEDAGKNLSEIAVSRRVEV